MKPESNANVRFTINRDLTIRETATAMQSGTNDFGDQLHKISYDYGYPEVLFFSMFYNMYRRNGVARAVADKVVEICWMTKPKIEGVQGFEELAERLDLWSRLKGLDSRQRVGRYSGLFMRVADGTPPNNPISGMLSGENSLVDVMPVYEGQLRVSSTYDDISSPMFDLPSMYQYNSNGDGGRNTTGGTAADIHPDRVIIAAEGADDGGIFGVSSLEAPFNALLDIVKIAGGGAEGYYRNVAQSLAINIDVDANTDLSDAAIKKIMSDLEDFTQNRMRRHLVLGSMDATPITSDLSSPKDAFQVALNCVAAASGIPATILIGQQTGRLASAEDSRHMLSMANSRRENFLTSMIRSFIDWCMDYGVLPRSQYSIVWDDLLEQSDEERLKNAREMAEINRMAYQSGSSTIFTEQEIRDQGGYDDELPDMETEGDGEFLEDGETN